MNKSKPITSRIQKRSIGGIVQPAIEGMGSVAKMYDSPAKNYKEGYYNSPAKVDSKNKYNSEGRSERNQSVRDAFTRMFTRREDQKPLFADEAQGREFYKKKHLGKRYKPPTESKDYTGEGPTVEKIKNKSTPKTEFAGRTPYTVDGGKGTIHGPKDSYKAAYKKRDMKIYGDMDLDQYTKEAKRQTKSFETTGKFDAPKKARKKVSKVTSLKPASVDNKKLSIENITTPGVKAEKLVAKAPKTAKQTRKSNSIDKKLAKAKTARASGNIKKAERKEKRVANKQERIAKRSRTRSENTAIKGRKAVDEGRDRKANRVLKRAANQENREIKREQRKAARADRKAAKGKMTMTKSKVDKKPKSSKKKVLDSSRVPM